MKLYGAAILYDLVTPFGKLKMVGEVHGAAPQQCNLDALIHDTVGDIWCELEYVDAVIAAVHVFQTTRASKPLDVCAFNYIINKQARYKPINVRRNAPFHILESVIHSQQFYTMFCKRAPTQEQKRVVKQFEKALTHHMRSRKSTMQFLNGLLANELPSWYQEFVEMFANHGMGATQGDFKATDLSVIEFAKKHWTTMVVDNEVYSAAMADYESTRETATNEPMVLDKYERELRDFFAKLFAVLMDVHILSKYMRERPKEVMIVAGVNHISRMIDFLKNNDMIDVNASTVCVRMTEGGGVDLDTEYIDTSVKRPFATVHMKLPAASPLNAFRERRGMA